MLPAQVTSNSEMTQNHYNVTSSRHKAVKTIFDKLNSERGPWNISSVQRTMHHFKHTPIQTFINMSTELHMLKTKVGTVKSVLSLEILAKIVNDSLIPLF